jgi:hypothetical protein
MTKIINISGKAQAGKDTAANNIKNLLSGLGYSCLIVHQADYLKFICKEYFGWDGKKDENGRGILQKIGTDIGRNRNPDIWVKVIELFINTFGEEYDIIIIPDVRFLNEVEYFKNSHDVLNIRIIRKDFDNGLTEEQKNHLSEISLDNYTFDVDLIIGEGLENSVKAVERCFQGLFRMNYFN